MPRAHRSRACGRADGCGRGATPDCAAGVMPTARHRTRGPAQKPCESHGFGPSQGELPEPQHADCTECLAAVRCGLWHGRCHVRIRGDLPLATEIRRCTCRNAGALPHRPAKNRVSRRNVGSRHGWPRNVPGRRSIIEDRGRTTPFLFLATPPLSSRCAMYGAERAGTYAARSGFRHATTRQGK